MHDRPTRPAWRRCECCTHVDFVTRPDGYSLGCNHPSALYGQAGKGRTCCSFEREPGSDDELDHFPPLVSF